MGWYEAVRNLHYKTKNRRMSFPLMSYEQLEFDYYNNTHFGTAAAYMIQNPQPIQMLLRTLRV